MTANPRTLAEQLLDPVYTHSYFWRDLVTPVARAYLDLHTWAEQARTALQRMRQANEAYTDDHEDDSSEAQPLCSICQEWFDADETLGRLLASFPGREDE